jgi:TolB-like protein/DNA-binding winged helix-turn-helix (wHTH) protein/Tfp pilus assembly protein PilF
MQVLAHPGVFLFADFRLDRPRGGLFRCGENGTEIPVALGSRALDILALLLDRRGDLVTKDEITAAVWQGAVVEESNLTVHIAALRRVLDEDRAQGSCIQTVVRRGYRFVMEVARLDAEGASDAPVIGDTAPLPVRDAPRSAPAVSLPFRSFGLPAPALIGPLTTLIPDQSRPETAAAPHLSIVVLPFASLGPDPEQEYFADAITDDLTTDLSRVAGSFVIARTTAFTYKGKAFDVRRVASELGVRYILVGSVRRTGDHVRVNVQLIDGETGGHLWADRFQADRANLAEAQDEVTSRLARMLNLELAEAAGRRVEQECRTDPDAHDLVMRGWAWWYRRMSPANRQQAQQAFEQALEADRHSVDARIGLATILVSNIADGWSGGAKRDLPRAEELLLEALERDPNRSMAHYAMAMVRRSQGRLIESKMEFEAAIALDRNNARAHFNLGQTLILLGQPEAAIPHVEKALRLNPYDPNAANFYWSLGMSYLLLNDPDRAIEFLTRARAGNPHGYYVHMSLAGALGLKGNLDDAKVALAEALALKPEINSLTRLREYAWMNNPPYWDLREKTINVGLRRIGFPEE